MPRPYPLKLFLLLQLVAVTLLPAQRIVSGHVVDEERQPLIGASIFVRGTTRGTTTDHQGSYQLLVDSTEQTLSVSYTGYEEAERQAVGDRIDFVLQSVTTDLQQVEVRGFPGAMGRARRRTASVLRTAESVYALSAEAIERGGVDNLEHFARRIPNVSFQASQNPGVNFINVRGIPQIRNGEAPVAFIIDGVTIPDPSLLNQDLFDLALVEIVKGPQGTLYGKNAIGGAINLLTRAPTNFAQYRAKIGYGNGDHFRAQLGASAPIVRDRLYFRFSAAYQNAEGVIENETLGEPVDFAEHLSVRTQLQWDLNNRFKATLAAQLSQQEGGAVYYAHSPNGLQLDANDFNYIIDADQRGEGTLDNRLFSLQLQWSLGQSILRSITSYNEVERGYFGDLDFLPQDILRQEQNSDSETFNQEFRWASTEGDGPLSWEVGTFLQASDRLLFTQATADFGFFADPVVPTGEQAILATLSNFTNQFFTLAAFGFVDYQLSDRWKLSLGLRVDRDRIKQENRLLEIEPQQTRTEWQPKISLAYQATENTLVFGNYGRGYRSGGFNSDNTDLFDAEYLGETTDNLEVGLKTATRNQRLVFTTGAFYTAFNNQQQYAVAFGTDGLVLGNYNLTETLAYGFEADLKYRLTNYLDLLSGFGYTSSEIEEAGTAGNIDRSNFRGNTTPFVPRTTFNIALESTFAIGENAEFSGFLNLNRKGELYWHEDNLDVADPYALVDGRIAYQLAGRYRLALWGRNLLDTEYYQEYFAGEISGSAAGDIAWVGKPRTFGVELEVRF